MPSPPAPKAPLSLQPSLLIFDCDGTLVDSEYMNNLATIRLLHEEGLTQFDIDYAFSHFVGLRLKQILSDISTQTGHVFKGDIAARYVALAESMMDEYLKPIPGAEDLVAAAQKHVKICVASNGQRDNVISSLERTGLKKYFPDEHIFSATQVANGKPAPDLFFLAAKTMGEKPEDCLIIEDSIAGVTAAKAAGIKVLGFVGAHTDQKVYAARLQSAGAAEVFDRLIPIQQRYFGQKSL